MTVPNSKMNLVSPRPPKSFASFLILIFVAITALAQAQSSVHRKEAWMAQYAVDRIFHQSGYTIITGESLGYLSQFSGSGAPVHATTGLMDRQWPAIDGIVYCAASDGTGGWYIGGTFGRVDTVKVKNVVHINGDGSVDRSGSHQYPDRYAPLLITVRQFTSEAFLTRLMVRREIMPPLSIVLRRFCPGTPTSMAAFTHSPSTTTSSMQADHSTTPELW